MQLGSCLLYGGQSATKETPCMLHIVNAYAVSGFYVGHAVYVKDRSHYIMASPYILLRQRCSVSRDTDGRHVELFLLCLPVAYLHVCCFFLVTSFAVFVINGLRYLGGEWKRRKASKLTINAHSQE